MRVRGWERALLDVVAKHRAQPFAWGTSDCFTLPLDAIVAITGTDPWPGLHDYDSRISAARCLSLQGYENLAAAFADKFPEVPVSFAQRGDVGVVNDQGNICGALFLASGCVGKTENGVVLFPREAVKRAFKVG